MHNEVLLTQLIKTAPVVHNLKENFLRPVNLVICKSTATSGSEEVAKEVQFFLLLVLLGESIVRHKRWKYTVSEAFIKKFYNKYNRTDVGNVAKEVQFVQQFTIITS